MPEGAREWLPGRVVAWLLAMMFVFSLGAAVVTARRGSDLFNDGQTGSSNLHMEQE